MKSLSNRLIVLVISCIFFAACSSSGGTKVAENEKANSIYKRAKSSLNVGDFETAISLFEKLESRYPFSQYALQTQLDLIYSYYKFGEKSAAIAQVDRFTRFNPTHPNVDYALYMKGVIQQNDRKGMFDRWTRLQREDFDVTTLQDAYTTFNDLITRFPSSDYAADARQRMVYIRNTIATHEWKVADFYLERLQYVASANRAKKVIQDFPETLAARKALVTLEEAYIKLGLTELADSTQTLIQANPLN